MTTQLLPLVVRVAGLECIGYYRNETAAGKDVCDTHFSYQLARLLLKAVQGEVSTAKQLVDALYIR